MHEEKNLEEFEKAFDEGGVSGYLRWQIKRDEQAEKEKAESGRMWNIAQCYARLAEIDKAFEWLEKAVQRRHGSMISIQVHPWLDSLRSDKRYGEILKKMNLAD